MLVTEATTYYFDLMMEQPKWKIYHKFSEAYDMKDLSPDSFAVLSERLKKD